MARVIVQHRQPEGDWVLAGGLGDLVHERLNGKGGVGRSHGPPPQHRDIHIRGRQVDLDAGDGIGDVVRPLDRAQVDAVGQRKAFERRAAEDRLADDVVVPGH